jgi:hypothetical protein
MKVSIYKDGGSAPSSMHETSRIHITLSNGDMIQIMEHHKFPGELSLHMTDGTPLGIHPEASNSVRIMRIKK